MNKIERAKMIKCMEFIARNLNDEEVFFGWLMNGVPDGDIKYGDLNPDDDEVEYLTHDGNFAEIMDSFLRIMSRAYKSGGLYCDGVVSKSFLERRKNNENH